MKLIIALGILCAIGSVVTSSNKHVVCYVGTWATYRWSYGKFDVEHIDPQLCTHLAYAFFGITENGDFRIIDPYLDLEENWGRGNVKKFNALKQQNPKLKTLAAVGGWNEGSAKFSDAAKDPIKRRRFIDTSIDFILKHKFDGLDLDWEYPAQRGGDTEQDKANYIVWLKELKTELDKHGLLLTAAVGATEASASQSYDIPSISKYLDLIHIMAYDLHGSWDNVTGINAPLYAGPNDITEYQKQLNVETIVQYWLKQGAPAHKIVIGTALYGRSFTLSDTAQTKPGSPFNGPGESGKFTQQPGFLGYNEICENIKTNGWIREWEDTQKVPYAYKGNQWIGYDDAESLKLKAEYINKYNLGGIMVWSLETDDFHGLCGEKYSLMKTINRALGSETAPTPTPTPPDETTSETEVTQAPTPSPNPEFKCKTDGYFRDPYDCSVYYVCIGKQQFKFTCPQGLWFDPESKACNYPALVDCKPLPRS